VTDVWPLRRCAVCNTLETDTKATFVFDQASDEIVHLVHGGIQRCGALVAVADQAES
jgi:hypothetical protein